VDRGRTVGAAKMGIFSINCFESTRIRAFSLYSIKSAILPSFAHVITGPKPCVNIVTRSCYSPVLPMHNILYKGPNKQTKNDDLAYLPKC
jgi:hypothetical protein